MLWCEEPEKNFLKSLRHTLHVAAPHGCKRRKKEEPLNFSPCCLSCLTFRFHRSLFVARHAGRPARQPIFHPNPSTMREPRQELWNAFFKERINSLRPRKYEGSSDISVFQLFCSECRQYLDEWGTAAEEDRVRQAALFLDGEAKLYYRSIEESSPPDDRPHSRTNFIIFYVKGSFRVSHAGMCYGN